MLRHVRVLAAAGLAATLIAAAVPDSQPPAIPAVDAPELARLGPAPVGVAELTVVQPRQLDPLRSADRPVLSDRELPLTIWYPAAAKGPGMTYHAVMSGADARDVAFTVPGIATRDAKPAPGRVPLVILAHGYGNAPAALSWLGENLASKGYVVVAPAFRDPPISIRTAAARSGPLARRPLDIAFVAGEVQRRAAAGEAPFAAADPSRTALIGYSMGGYGVLTAAGAPLDPRMAEATRGALADAVAGRPQAGRLKLANVKAVVAIAPASGTREAPIWAAPGVAAITAPTLYIVGNRDKAVGYDPGVRTLFQAQAHAPRYLLTFREAGHSIALIGAPPEMRGSFWDLDWFEDPVWRKDRLLAVQMHFITAFLDRHVKGDVARGAYLDGLVPDANAGNWPDAPVGRHPGYSPDPPTATVWKGFQPSRATGMSLEYLPAR